MDKEPLTKKKKAMYEAMGKQLGIISAASRQSGVCRESHYKWMRNDPNYRAWIEDIANRTHDFVENALLQEIRKGNHACIIFYLKTKGKSRGYVEEQKLEVTGNVLTLSPIELQDQIKRLLK